LYFENALRKAFPKHNKYFENTMHGYSLIAISNKYKAKNAEIELGTLTYLPYYNVIPAAIITNKIFYTRTRLDFQILLNDSNKFYYHAMYPTFAGMPFTVAWILRLQVLLLSFL